MALQLEKALLSRTVRAPRRRPESFSFVLTHPPSSVTTINTSLPVQGRVDDRLRGRFCNLSMPFQFGVAAVDAQVPGLFCLVGLQPHLEIHRVSEHSTINR